MLRDSLPSSFETACHHASRQPVVKLRDSLSWGLIWNTTFLFKGRQRQLDQIILMTFFLLLISIYLFFLFTFSKITFFSTTILDASSMWIRLCTISSNDRCSSICSSFCGEWDEDFCRVGEEGSWGSVPSQFSMEDLRGWQELRREWLAFLGQWLESQRSRTVLILRLLLSFSFFFFRISFCTSTSMYSNFLSSLDILSALLFSFYSSFFETCELWFLLRLISFIAFDIVIGPSLWCFSRLRSGLSVGLQNGLWAGLREEAKAQAADGEGLLSLRILFKFPLNYYILVVFECMSESGIFVSGVIFIESEQTRHYKIFVMTAASWCKSN